MEKKVQSVLSGNYLTLVLKLMIYLPHVIGTSDDIWDPTVLDHSIDIENDIYQSGMDSNIDAKDFTSFDECTSMTGTYLHHDSNDPD